MDIADKGGGAGLSRLLKKIWNGPYQDDLEAEEESPMDQDRRSSAGYDGNTFSKREDSYETREPQRMQSHGAREGRRPGPDDALLSAGRYPEGRAEAVRRPENITVISPGTTVVGDVKSDGSIEMLGTMTGSIVTSGDVKVNGKQNGNIQGANIELTACAVRGSLNAAEDIHIDGGSVVVGDIKCGNLTIDGKLKGNVHVMGNVDCQGNSVLIGDVTSTTITVGSGAKLKGRLEISDGSIDPIDIKESKGKEKPAEKPPEKPQEI